MSSFGAETERDRRESFTQEDKKRGRRLFGGLLNTLSQTTSNSQQKRRLEIEKRQQEKATQQAREDDKRRSEKLAKLERIRKIEQVRFDEQVVSAGGLVFGCANGSQTNLLTRSDRCAPVIPTCLPWRIACGPEASPN
jgi:hypothetical protein